MNALAHPVRSVLTLALLGLALTGCLRRLDEVPGCTEGKDCTPDTPVTAPTGALVPPLPSTAQSARISGRHLEVSIEVHQPQSANELEILCGNRRLATWSVPKPAADSDSETVTLGAMVDLLPCWTGGEPTQPSEPFELTLVIVDQLEARHASSAGWVRFDPRIGEGGEAPASEWPVLTLSHRRLDGTFLLTSDQALASPPVAHLEGRPAQVLATPAGWVLRLPHPQALDGSGVLRGESFEANLKVSGTSLAGRTTHLSLDFPTSFTLRPALALPGNVSSAIDTPGMGPVASAEGLVVLSYEPDLSRVIQLIVQPDGTLVRQPFALDTEAVLQPGSCSQGGTGATGLCPLALNAEGRLLARDAATGALRLQSLPLSIPAGGSLEAQMVAVAPTLARESLPYAWVPAGESLCTENRDTCSLDCSTLGHRVCVAPDGSVSVEAPINPHGLNPGNVATAVSTGAGFATYQYSDASSLPVPALGFGLPGSGYRWYDWFDLGQPDENVVPYGAGTGVALIPSQPDLNPSNLLTGSGEALRYQFHAPGPGVIAPVSQATYVDAQGRVTLIGLAADGRAVLTRWAPGALQPEAQQSFGLGDDPTYYEPLVASIERTAAELGRPLANGGAVMTILVQGGSEMSWLVLAVDAELRPIWSRLFTGLDVDDPPIPIPSRDGSVVWVISRDPFDSSLRRVHFLPGPG